MHKPTTQTIKIVGMVVLVLLATSISILLPYELARQLIEMLRFIVELVQLS